MNFWKRSKLYIGLSTFINLKQAGLFKSKDPTLIMGICKNGNCSDTLNTEQELFLFALNTFVAARLTAQN